MAPELNFTVEGVEAVRHAAVPQLTFKLRVQQSGEPPLIAIQAIALQCQIRIEPMRRRYDEAARSKLKDLFGEPQRWGQTLRTMLWTHASAVVPPFSDVAIAEVRVPCTFDFNVAATKYFDGLGEGEIPLSFLFSGTIFHETEDGRLQVAQIPWEKEAAYRLNVQVWREMMEHYYPNSAWLRLRRDVFDLLADYKRRNSIPTWEQALEILLADETAKAMT